MLTVGEKLPAYKLRSVVSTEPGKQFQDITHETYQGKWQVLFFWPMDFTFVCPTEIAEFGRRNKEFSDRNVQVLGISTDTHYVHLAWRQSHPDLRDLSFPMLADTKRELSSALGILHREEGVPLRATFIIDPEGVVRFVSVNDLKVGRNVEEVLRVIDALQTGELTPCNWRRGEKTLQAASVAKRRSRLPLNTDKQKGLPPLKRQALILSTPFRARPTQANSRGYSHLCGTFCTRETSYPSERTISRRR